MKTVIFIVRLLSWFFTVGLAYQWGAVGLGYVGVVALVLFFIATLIHLCGDLAK